jgi:hypothetical protein
VSFRDLQARVMVYGAQYRHFGIVLNHRAQFSFMTRTTEIVEDHAGDANIRIKCLIA